MQPIKQSAPLDKLEQHINCVIYSPKRFPLRKTSGYLFFHHGFQLMN
jgi:hypothetical protein